MISDFAFSELGLTRIEIVVAKGNGPSNAVARKVGAVYEGMMRNRLVLHGAPVTASMYSLIPQDLADKFKSGVSTDWLKQAVECSR